MIELKTPLYDSMVKKFKSKCKTTNEINIIATQHILAPARVIVYEELKPYNDKIVVWEGTVYRLYYKQFIADLTRIYKGKYRAIVSDKTKISTSDFAGDFRWGHVND